MSATRVTTEKLFKEMIDPMLDDLNNIFEEGFKLLEEFDDVYRKPDDTPSSLVGRMLRRQGEPRELTKATNIAKRKDCLSSINIFTLSFDLHWKGFCDAVKEANKTGEQGIILTQLANLLEKYYNLWIKLAKLNSDEECAGFKGFDRVEKLFDKLETFKKQYFKVLTTIPLLRQYKGVTFDKAKLPSILEKFDKIVKNPKFKNGILPSMEIYPIGKSGAASASAASASKRGGARRRRTLRKRKATRRSRGRSRKA